ncbi:MAG TPA: gluconate 2-dehydrogenase subunit 3 family protein [Ktedonobacterales bacterium]|nr:gluconate 2-dehydrogenase subunit 3 family protein [Ktedonobacterales bacterium]
MKLKGIQNNSRARGAKRADAHPTVSRDNLPRDSKTGNPILPTAQPGYYPGFSTLRQQAFWDEATRAVILKRVTEIPPIRFFSPEEHGVMVAVTSRILPQDDRDDAHKIPIVPFLDEKLLEDTINGYRYETMPPQRETYRLFIKGVQAIAQHVFHMPYEELRADHQDYVLQSIHDGTPPAGDEFWSQLSLSRLWQIVVNDTVHIYYAHPYAWDEIGFGGPAYPRGYMRLHHGEPEPWEVEERRYEWDAPPLALSDTYRPIGKESPLEGELHTRPSMGGVGGTH